ncbi:uncharacterized protein DMENIID0001_101340 [Sergentomyia squamirostris]
MSQSPPNYIDGVPVKISENYRPPRIISLPQSTRNRLERREHVPQERHYDFSLERNVLGKVREWKAIRDSEENVRRERILMREQERRRMMEERQKALLTQVSYPSTEDLSSEEELSEQVEKAKENHQTPQGHFSPPTNFDTILMPTVLPESRGGTTCPDPQRLAKPPFSVLSKINYSDFEGDSSPFDNLELKTINDLDILAQVLKTSATIDNSTNGDVESSPKTNEEAPGIPETIQTTTLDTNPVHNSQDYYALSQVSYDLGNISTEMYTTPSIPINQQQAYLNYPTDNYSATLYSHQTNMHQPAWNMNGGGYYYGVYGSPTVNRYATQYGQQQFQTVPPSVPDKSKSKSVPDIANELNNEIERHSERRRIRNNSQTIQSPCDEEKEYSRKKPRETTFTQLSESSQRLATTISTMGFPLDRVSRVTQVLGNDDKKIVDHLIPLSELLDLGFEEAKISEALLKFDNNKERALEFLIS